VLPASSTRTIQHAIRTGKLNSDGQLIGAEDDSASEEEDQTMQEVLDLLKKGQIYNLGPNGEYVHVVPPKASVQKSSSNNAAAITPPPAIENSQQFNAQLPIIRPKSSKFKASRAAMGRPSTSQANIPEFEVISPSLTPVSHAGRSSPKSVDSPNVMELSVNERKFTTITPPSQTVNQPPPCSMIVDSPSFPMPEEPDKQFLSSTTTISVVGSPHRTQSYRRPERPPTVIAASVLERKAAGTSQEPAIISSNQPAKKISRFKAERM